jgi:hypothetical protein
MSLDTQEDVSLLALLNRVVQAHKLSGTIQSFAAKEVHCFFGILAD